MLDIADVSLEQMQNRYKTLRDRSFTAEFYPMDCYQVKSTESYALHKKKE